MKVDKVRYDELEHHTAEHAEHLISSVACDDALTMD